MFVYLSGDAGYQCYLWLSINIILIFWQLITGHIVLEFLSIFVQQSNNCFFSRSFLWFCSCYRQQADLLSQYNYREKHYIDLIFVKFGHEFVAIVIQYINKCGKKTIATTTTLNCWQFHYFWEQQERKNISFVLHVCINAGFDKWEYKRRPTKQFRSVWFLTELNSSDLTFWQTNSAIHFNAIPIHCIFIGMLNASIK